MQVSFLVSMEITTITDRGEFCVLEMWKNFCCILFQFLIY